MQTLRLMQQVVPVLIQETLEASIYDCLVDDVDVKSLIIETDNPNLSVLPAHIDLVGAELEMISMSNREHRLKMALDQVKDDYDFIIIDCSPSLGLITVNALNSCRFCYYSSSM